MSMSGRPNCRIPTPGRARVNCTRYVRNEAQGLKLGGKLLAIALAHLEETRPGPIWLGVWSGNERAQAIYTKIGFRKVGDYLFPVGEWRDQEFIFRRD